MKDLGDKIFFLVGVSKDGVINFDSDMIIAKDMEDLVDRLEEFSNSLPGGFIIDFEESFVTTDYDYVSIGFLSQHGIVCYRNIADKIAITKLGNFLRGEEYNLDSSLVDRLKMIGYLENSLPAKGLDYFA